MRERVVIRSESELWELVGVVGGNRVTPLDRLTLERGLLILSDLGLAPSWRDDESAISRLVAESRAMKLGAARLAQILDAKPGTLKKIFQLRGRCPCFDLAVRWAAALEARREMSPDGAQSLVLEVCGAQVNQLDGGQAIVDAQPGGPEGRQEAETARERGPAGGQEAETARERGPAGGQGFTSAPTRRPDGGQERRQGFTSAPTGIPEGGQERGQGSASAPMRGQGGGPDGGQETLIAQIGGQGSATAQAPVGGAGRRNSEESPSKILVDTPPPSAQGSSSMAIIEWRLGGEVRLRVVLPRELVAKRIEAERRAGTPGQIYIDNERFDDQELRIAEIEETLKVQNDLLQQIVKRLNAPGKPGAPAQAADPEMEAIKELMRRAEELSEGRSFSWGRELLHGFIAAKKEEKGDG